MKKLDEKPTRTNGALYAINLMNSRGQSFNKLAVEKGFVTAVEEEASFVQDVEVVDPAVETDEDDEGGQHMDEWKSLLTDPVVSENQKRDSCEELEIPIIPASEFNLSEHLQNFIDGLSDEGLENFLDDDPELKNHLKEVCAFPYPCMFCSGNKVLLTKVKK